MRLLCTLTFFTLLHPVFSQNTMTLEDCIQFGLKNSTAVRLAELQIRDAEWQIKENTASGLPTITAGITAQRFLKAPALPLSALGFPEDPTMPGGKVQFVQDNEFTGNIQATQLVFSNSYIVARKAAKFYREYVQVQLEDEKRKVRNSITDAYLPALLISENVEVLDKNIANLGKLRDETQEIQKAGFAEQLDVDRLDLSIMTLTDERSNLLRQRDVVVNALKFTMNYKVEDDLSLQDDLDALMATAETPDLTSQINFSSRSDYQLLMKGRELSLLQNKVYEKTWLPTVSAFGSYNASYQGNNSLFFVPSALVGLNISIPIYDFGETKAKHERAKLQTEEIDVQRGMLENAIQLEVVNARKMYENAQARLANQRKNLDLAQRIYDTTQTKYKAGVGSSIEMITAEQALYTAQQSLMTAQYDLLNAKTAIRKALN